MLLVLLLATECLQVVLRYFFSIGLFWAADVTVLLLLSLAWLGAAHLWATGAHLTIRFFTQSGSRYHNVVNTISDVLAVVGTIWLLPEFYSAIELYSSIVMPAISLPVATKYLPPAVGLLLIAIVALCNLVETFWYKHQP